MTAEETAVIDPMLAAVIASLDQVARSEREMLGVLEAGVHDGQVILRFSDLDDTRTGAAWLRREQWPAAIGRETLTVTVQARVSCRSAAATLHDLRDRGNATHSAVCDCGWESDPSPLVEDLERSVREHIAERAA